MAIPMAHQSAKRIQEARLALPGRGDRPLSQEGLARRVGVTVSTIQKWEREGFPHADHLAALASALEESADWIVGAPPPPPFFRFLVRDDDARERRVRSRVIELLDATGLSVSELSKKLEVSPTTIRAWRRGERALRTSALASLADLAGVTLAYAFGQTDDPSGTGIDNPPAFVEWGGDLSVPRVVDHDGQPVAELAEGAREHTLSYLVALGFSDFSLLEPPLRAPEDDRRAAASPGEGVASGGSAERERGLQEAEALDRPKPTPRRSKKAG